MKDQINRAIATASIQQLAVADIRKTDGLAAIGIYETLDLVLELEPTVKDMNGLAIEVPDDVWPDWVRVSDVYKFYGVAP